MPDSSTGGIPPVTFREALRFWFKLGWISFGGPAGQIAIMQTELVYRLRWIDQRSFLNGLNFCTLLPGPEAQQLATYIGWLMHKTRGGLLAGGLFILPGAVAIMALSYVYAAFGHVLSGIAIVRKIAHLPAENQQLITPVKILKITRVH